MLAIHLVSEAVKAIDKRPMLALARSAASNWREMQQAFRKHRREENGAVQPQTPRFLET